MAWRLVFDYLKAAYPGRATWQGADPHQLMLEGFDDGWEVNLQDELAILVVEGPPAARVEVIACLRRHVPSDVELQVFDDQLTYEPTSLPPDITTEEIRVRFFRISRSRGVHSENLCDLGDDAYDHPCHRQ